MTSNGLCADGPRKWPRRCTCRSHPAWSHRALSGKGRSTRRSRRRCATTSRSLCRLRRPRSAASRQVWKPPVPDLVRQKPVLPLDWLQPCAPIPCRRPLVARPPDVAQTSCRVPCFQAPWGVQPAMASGEPAGLQGGVGNCAPPSCVGQRTDHSVAGAQARRDSCSTQPSGRFGESRRSRTTRASRRE